MSTAGCSLHDYIKTYIRSAYGGDPSLFTSPLYLLLSTIQFLPYPARKHLLDCTRIQSSQYINKTLSQSYSKCIRDCPYVESSTAVVHSFQVAGFIQWTHQNGKPLKTKMIRLKLVLDLFENFFDNAVLCSLISYFVRAERTEHPTQFIGIGKDNLDKELKASQSEDKPQQLDYRGLFTDKLYPIHPGWKIIPVRTRTLFVRHLGHLQEHLQKSTTLIFPHYNGKKNIGYQSQTLLYESLYHTLPDKQPTGFTSLDLLKHYAKTGRRVGGPLELRQAWRFNDLKPRSYYCLGGESYWAAIYIKDFTKELLKAFPSTHPFSRFEVKRIDRLERDEILVTYDYSSFTTSLAELKYFMWYLANSFDGVEVTVLDPHRGLIDIDMGEYLHEYNSRVNMGQIFDIFRLTGDHHTAELRQHRNGSLGIGGNIGFSGLTHGISLAGFNDTPDKDSVVGDDALLKTIAESLQVLLVFVNKLGLINPEKVTQIPRPAEMFSTEEEQHAFKYLKRPISVNYSGDIKVGFLDFFPNVAALLFPEGDGIHTVQAPEDPVIAVKGFCMQVGKFFSNFRNIPSPMQGSEGEDMHSVLSIFQAVYDKYGLPIAGAIPTNASYYGLQDEVINAEFWIPPIDTLEVFHTSWMSVLFSRYEGLAVTLPVLVDAEMPLPDVPYPGGDFVATRSGPMITFLEDMGFLTTRLQTYVSTFTDTVMMQMEEFFSRGFVKDRHMVYSVTFLEIPPYYADLYGTIYGDWPIVIEDRQADIMTLDLGSLDSDVESL